MNMFNKLPQYVYIKNKRYFVNSDFRLFVNFEVEMQGKDTEKAIKNCLIDFYPAFLELVENNLINEAVEQFLWFYKCGRKEEEIKKTSKNSNKSSKQQIYSYEFDDELIFGAFLEQYNIDLSKKYLHWWKFKALLKSLSSECEFSKIKSYRGYNGKDKELLELKEVYKLPLTGFALEEKERQQKIYDELTKYH